MIIDDIDFRPTLVTFCVLRPRKTIWEKLRLSMPYDLFIERIEQTHSPFIKDMVFFFPLTQSKNKQAYRVKRIKVDRRCEHLIPGFQECPFRLHYTYFLEKYHKNG
jgi:hypothetical protein